MNSRPKTHRISSLAASTALIWVAGSGVATATEPCEDFGECKALIEINSSDGDIGFHFLMDGDDLNSARIHDPDGKKVFEDQAKGPLREQKLTETFAESAEPLCWMDPDADPEDWEDIVTLDEFLEPDVDDGDPIGALVFRIRVPGDIATTEVTVPAEYLASLPDDTPAKIEVGAIGGEDNATFTEEDGFCINEDEGCD